MISFGFQITVTVLVATPKRLSKSDKHNPKVPRGVSYRLGLNHLKLSTLGGYQRFPMVVRYQRYHLRSFRSWSTWC